MNHNFLALGLLLFFSVILCLFLLMMPRLFGARSSQEHLLDVFECGVPIRDAMQRRMQVRFYLVALVFIIFDIEAVFLFPWAVLFRQLGLFGLVEMLFFVGILTLGLAYVWRKGGLEWE